MTPPPAGLVRVFAQVGVESRPAGVWLDIPEAKLEDLLQLQFVSLTDNAGNGPPAELTGLRCC